MKLIGLTGFAGSGKGSVADVLVKQGFQPHAFADALKDVCSLVFSWDRKLLEGNTNESRIFRETVDTWWANRLGIPEFSPRYAMQTVGTEAFRHVIHYDIWVQVLESKLMQYSSTDKIVIPDTRFKNEIQMVRRLNGRIIRVERDERPKFWSAAEQMNQMHEPLRTSFRYEEQRDLLKDIHESEYSWIGVDQPNAIIHNNGSLDDLAVSVDIALRYMN